MDQPDKAYLYTCKSIAVNIDNCIACQLVNDTIHQLDVERTDFLLLLSDAARYMTLAGNILKTMYSKMFHVTCVAHLLHNCAMVLK